MDAPKMKEEQRHIDAFEKYLQHRLEGKKVDETLRLVKGEYKVSMKSLYRWKKEFNWDQREAIRSQEIRKGVETQTNNTIIDFKAKRLNELEEIFKKSPLPPIKNPHDYKTLAELQLRLYGEDSLTDNRVEVIIREAKPSEKESKE